MEIIRATEERYEEARRVFSTALGSGDPPNVGLRPPYWDLDRSWLAVEDDVILGVAATFAARMTLPGGGHVPCAAVPNVGVRADQHGRGVGRALVEHQIGDARDAGDVLMALNASETAIYGRFGYSPSSRWWSVEVDLHRLRWRDAAPADPGRVREVDDPQEALRIAREVHERSFGVHHGEVGRGDGWWARYTARRPDDPKPRFAVHETDGVADAVVRFGVKLGFDDVGFSNKVTVDDLVRTTPAAGGHLLRWLCDLNLAGRLTMDRCDTRTPVPWWLDDARVWRTTAWADAVWVRVLDVPAAVAASATIGRGEVVVAVEDPLVPQNARNWRIAGEDGVLTCEATDAAPAVVIPHGMLASLLFGYVPVATAASAGVIGVGDARGVPVLDALWSWPTPGWCSTGF